MTGNDTVDEHEEAGNEEEAGKEEADEREATGSEEVDEREAAGHDAAGNDGPAAGASTCRESGGSGTDGSEARDSGARDSEAGDAEIRDSGAGASGTGGSGAGDAEARGQEGDASSAGAPEADEHGVARPSRRFPLFTRDTARPEGGGRAAPGDAPAPARQWPLLTVLCVAGIGLLIVATDPFAEAFRVGTVLIGAALLGGAVLRLVVPSVGMLAVRSRFTDLVTYGLLGFLIVMLALVAQPKPWLDIPFLEDAVHFTIR
ncbi:DUF3017 domain-containing protein [Streptomyces sp. NPDC014734]|uniref:DUF3017 domain-containing protein n=1 Tax=Streptomyces sp. NPDC014734 TaxID=3364886 RepID=UPI0036F7E48A